MSNDKSRFFPILVLFMVSTHLGHTALIKAPCGALNGVLLIIVLILPLIVVNVFLAETTLT